MSESSCLRRYYRVPLHEVGYLRFLLEAYDGLAQQRSLPGRGEVEWIIPVERAGAADQLARALAEEVGLCPIARPADWPP